MESVQTGAAIFLLAGALDQGVTMALNTTSPQSVSALIAVDALSVAFQLAVSGVILAKAGTMYGGNLTAVSPVLLLIAQPNLLRRASNLSSTLWTLVEREMATMPPPGTDTATATGAASSSATKFGKTTQSNANSAHRPRSNAVGSV